MKKYLIIITLVAAVGCVSKKVFQNNLEKNQIQKNFYRLEIPAGLIEPDIPINNDLTSEKIELGKMLFFEKNLSKYRNVSCATCHDASLAFSEHLTTSIRSNATATVLPDRNSISVINSGFQATLGWHGQFRSLEEQALGAFLPYGDMGLDIGEALQRIDSPLYQSLFKKAFKDGLTAANFAKAIGTYERSLLSGDTRFDRFLFKNDEGALNENEKAGYELFIGRASCITCHDVFHPSINALGGGIALFTDHRFHNLGVGYENGRMNDVGRFALTQDFADWGNFKTPSLRNVELTAPYMHDGSLKTLEEVVDFYNKGGNPNPNISPGVKKLFLSEREKADIVSFLKTLTDKKYSNSTMH